MLVTDTHDMTTTTLDTRQQVPTALTLWAAVRTRMHQVAEHRQLRRELAPFGVTLAGVAPSDSAVTREIRAMISV